MYIYSRYQSIGYWKQKSIAAGYSAELISAKLIATKK
jgi:hypothetical protein